MTDRLLAFLSQHHELPLYVISAAVLLSLIWLAWLLWENFR